MWHEIVPIELATDCDCSVTNVKYSKFNICGWISPRGHNSEPEYNPICWSGFVPLDWENQIGISDLSSGEPKCSNMGFRNIFSITVWILCSNNNLMKPESFYLNPFLIFKSRDCYHYPPHLVSECSLFPILLFYHITTKSLRFGGFTT